MAQEPIIIELNNNIEPPSQNAENSISIDRKETSLYIFFSMDICDSTKMKDKVKNWKDVILNLYKAQEDFKDIMSVWKYVGDEVVFCTAFSGVEPLVKLINIAYNKLESVEKELTKLANIKDYRVSIKGTMWLAYISDDPSHTNQISGINEFLGKQIDEGFRMTGFSASNKLLLDPKIVFILLFLLSIDATTISVLDDDSPKRITFAKDFLKNIEPLIDDYQNKKNSLKNIITPYGIRKEISKLVKHIYFIRYEKLKGIWNDNPYPIYWYSPSPAEDEYPRINSDELLPILINQINSKMFYSLGLMSIFDKVGVKSDIHDILNVVSENSPSQPYLKNDTAQLYYSIACVKNGKVFVAKRCYERKHLKGVWEFGFLKHTLAYTCDDIRKFFKTEFNLTVEPITDGTVDNNLVPLHFCTTYRNTNKHNSILCCAEILDDYPIEELKQRIEKHLKKILQEEKESRYSEVDFVDAKDAKMRFEDLTLEDVYVDAYNVSTGNTHRFNDVQDQNKDTSKQKAIVYFTDSVKYVLDFYNRWTSLDNNKWYDLFSDDGDD